MATRKQTLYCSANEVLDKVKELENMTPTPKVYSYGIDHENKGLIIYTPVKEVD